jgi:hypothetical protein
MNYSNLLVPVGYLGGSTLRYPQRHPCTCEQPNMWTKLWGAKEPNVDREVDPPAAPQGQPRTPSEAPPPEVFGR